MKVSRILIIVGLMGSPTPLYAVSKVVKDACGSDYTAYCSEHEIGSTALRSCMRSVRKKLSNPCVQALAQSGEASADDISNYKRETGK